MKKTNSAFSIQFADGVLACFSLIMFFAFAYCVYSFMSFSTQNEPFSWTLLGFSLVFFAIPFSLFGAFIGFFLKYFALEFGETLSIIIDFFKKKNNKATK